MRTIHDCHFAIERVDGSISLRAIADAGRKFPVVYVFFARPGIESELRRLFRESEEGEVVLLGEYQAGNEVCKKFGVTGAESMLGFAVRVFAGSADAPDRYADGIRETRDWRHRNKTVEDRYWPNGPAQRT